MNCGSIRTVFGVLGAGMSSPPGLGSTNYSRYMAQACLGLGSVISPLVFLAGPPGRPAANGVLRPTCDCMDAGGRATKGSVAEMVFFSNLDQPLLSQLVFDIGIRQR